MLEKKVEEHLVKRVKEAGGIAFKFTSPQRRSVPDRLVLLGVVNAGAELKKLMRLCGVTAPLTNLFFECEAAKIVAAAVRFVETKATGAKPTPGQLREHARLRALGFRVDVVDNKEDIDKEYGK